VPLDPRQAELAAWATQLASQEGMTETGIPGVFVVRANSATAPLPSVYEPSLCIVLQGRKRTMLRQETYIYDPFHYLVVSVSLPMAGQIIEASPERPYLCLRIPIDLTVIAELLPQVNVPVRDELPSDRGVFVARTSDAMLDAVLRLVHLLDEPQDASVLASLVLREIHYRVLTGQLGHRLHELCSSSHVQRISRAISYIKAHFAEPLRIEVLADALHMSGSSLHHHFKSVTAMSPLQFQKHLRLHEARRLMLMEGLDAAAAGYRVGYESASQFSREYRRLFGAPPRREIEAVRA
jgi:AraC-like DNA-binding protein